VPNNEEGTLKETKARIEKANYLWTFDNSPVLFGMGPLRTWRSKYVTHN
jgi:hypothetical protein